MKNDYKSIQLLTVGHNEVEEMLDAYDSGMSDRTTQNAVALALKKILKPNICLKVFHNGANGSCECRIRGNGIELPDTLVSWLERAERALPVNPISFPVLLKNKWLMNPVISSGPMPKEALHNSHAA